MELQVVEEVTPMKDPLIRAIELLERRAECVTCGKGPLRDDILAFLREQACEPNAQLSYLCHRPGRGGKPGLHHHGQSSACAAYAALERLEPKPEREDCNYRGHMGAGYYCKLCHESFLDHIHGRLACPDPLPMDSRRS
jgi:hypothetical protein